MTKREKIYKQLTEPLYATTKDFTTEQVEVQIASLCTALRLDQRCIAIIGINKQISQATVEQVIANQNKVVFEDNDPQEISCKLVPVGEFNVLLLYKDLLYLHILNDVIDNDFSISIYTYHYVLTKLFGYSDRTLKLFLKKWANKDKPLD
jgi:hypothetical protein